MHVLYIIYNILYIIYNLYYINYIILFYTQYDVLTQFLKVIFDLYHQFLFKLLELVRQRLSCCLLVELRIIRQRRLLIGGPGSRR